MYENKLIILFRMGQLYECIHGIKAPIGVYNLWKNYNQQVLEIKYKELKNQYDKKINNK